MTRILASGQAFPQYSNVGESERLNVNLAINNNEDVNMDVLLSHDQNATFQRVFFEEEAKQTIGLVNRSSQPITINSFEIAGNDDSWSTDIDQIINQTIEPGGVLSIAMEYDNRNSTDSVYASGSPAVIGLSNGIEYLIHMYGRELTFPTIELSNDFTDGGVVPVGSVVEGEFEIINNSKLPLYFDVVQSLQRFMPEESNHIETNAGFKPVKTFAKNKPKEKSPYVLVNENQDKYILYHQQKDLIFLSLMKFFLLNPLYLELFLVNLILPILLTKYLRSPRFFQEIL